MLSEMAGRTERESLNWLLLALACAMLVTTLYGQALSLPFFFDDFVHYPFVEANSVARIWLTTDELAYYRPLNFTIWRVTYDIFQAHVPWVDHGVNLLLFATNGFLVGWLAGRLWPSASNGPDWWRVFLASALFLLFPFSYQAVPWVGSLSHITVTLLILLSLAGYVQMRRTGRRWWGLVGLLAAFLAPFAHENGVLVMPLIVLIDLTTPGLTGRWRRALRSALIWSLPLLVYVPLWLSLPRLDSGGLFANSLEGVLQNSAYFAQGVFYPFTGIGGWLRTELDVRDMTAVALLTLAGLTVALLIQSRQRAGLRSLLPWLWIVLASLPAVLFLVFDYVINGPRLLMVASVGAAWLWTDVTLLFSRGGEKGSAVRWIRAAAALLVTGLLLLQNSAFIRARMEMHTILGDGFRQVIAATAEANAAGDEIVVVNFPSWLAPKQATFALGHEGVLFWPDYVPPSLLMAVHTGELGDLTFVKADGIRPELARYHYGLTGPLPDWAALADGRARVYGTAYEADGVQVVPAGELGVAAARERAPLAAYHNADDAPAAALLAAEATAVKDGIRVESLWQVDGAAPGVTLFVHAVDQAGTLVGQADGDLLGGALPLTEWPRQTVVRDSRLVPIKDYSNVQIRLGLYDRQTGQRLAVDTGPETTIVDDVVTLTVGEGP